MNQFNRGFTLLESTGALALILLAGLFVLPLYTTAAVEIRSVQQEQKALAVLEEEAWLVNTAEITKQPYQTQSPKGIYTLWTHKEQGGTTVCVEWEAQNKRTTEKCIYVYG